MQLSERLSLYALSLYEKGPAPETRRLALSFWSDTFAVMLAGCKEPAARLAATYAEEYGKRGRATILAGYGTRVDAYFAAMANGTAAHVHDFDDVCTTMIGHPSVAVLPAVLAMAQELGNSGEETLRSYVVGIETCALLGRLLCPEINKRGWHSTEAIGVFGATAAAACLLGLNPEQLQNAIGIAASEACALKVNYGTMTKSFHAGRAAAKGIMCARFGQMGFTASHKALEGESGFIEAFSGAAHMDLFDKAIVNGNSEFIDAGLTMKPWPCCKGMHNAIWAMLELMEEYDWLPDDIDHIDCRVLPFAKDMLIYEIARTPLQGKFSMNYTIAKIVLQRRLLMSDFEGDAVTEARLIEMMGRVHMIVDETLIPGGGYYDASECEQVDVYLKDGTMVSRFCAKAKGTPDNPMSAQERRAKMGDCMSYYLRGDAIPGIIEKIESIDQIETPEIIINDIEAARAFN